MPRPPYLTEEWLHAHGVNDTAELLDALRSENEVMLPERLRTVKATRLSFARTLIRRMTDNRWRIDLVIVDVQADGSGKLVYAIEAEGQQFYFAVAARPTEEEDRLGRFNETEFDFYGSLLDGPVDLARARHEMEDMSTKLWKARTDNRSFGWTIANRSQRYFAHVVNSLASGRQPDQTFLASGGGYIVRNAGWYGNGRQGSRSWLSLGPHHPFGDPYGADLFALYLWRLVAVDLVEAIARKRSPNAVQLDPAIRRALGVGNASGIGMVAALVRWPAWLSAYNFLRELALAFVVSRRGPVERHKAARLDDLLRSASRYYSEQPRSSVEEVEEPQRLGRQLSAVQGVARELVERGTIRGRRPAKPWAEIAAEAERLGSRELLEQVHSLLIEVESDFADALCALFPKAMSIPREIEPRMTVRDVQELISSRYRWALALDLTGPEARFHFWYRSEENAENRRGERGLDAGAENETFVDVAGAVQALSRALRDAPPLQSIGRFLMTAPEHSHAVSRVQLAGVVPYSEICGNIVGRDFLPMDGIRFLLSTLGLEASQPHSTRWVRGVFLQGAPLPHEIAAGEGADWLFPSLTEAASA